MEIKSYSMFHSLLTNMQLDIMLDGYLYADHTWDFFHYEPCHRLYYIMEGAAYFFKDHEENKIPLKPGHIYMLPRQHHYGLKCHDHMEKFFIHFNLDAAPGLDVFQHFDSHLEMPFYDEKLYNLHLLAQEGSYSSSLACKAILYETIGLFLEPFSDKLHSQLHHDKRFEKLFGYLDQSCHFGITVTELADFMNLSPSYLSRTFKKDTGITLKSYIQNRIIEKAKKLLLYTDKNIKETAYELGFNDAFYFSHYFKKHTNQSPLYYKQINSHYLRYDEGLSGRK